LFKTPLDKHSKSGIILRATGYGLRATGYLMGVFYIRSRM